MRFKHVDYDDKAKQQTAEFKAQVELIESTIDLFPNSRPKNLALTALEECYMWLGKMIRDEQLNRDVVVAGPQGKA